MDPKWYLWFFDSNDEEPSHCSFDTWKEMLRPPTRRPLMLVIPYFIIQQFSGMTSIRPFMVHVFRQLGLHDAAEWTTVSGLSPLTLAHRLQQATVLANSANQEIPRMLWSLKVHYNIHQITRHRFLLLTRRTHSTPYSPTYLYLRSTLILSSHLRQVFQTTSHYNPDMEPF